MNSLFNLYGFGYPIEVAEGEEQMLLLALANMVLRLINFLIGLRRKVTPDQPELGPALNPFAGPQEN